MKLLLDQDVYAQTERFLAELGHDIVQAAKLGLAQIADMRPDQWVGTLDTLSPGSRFRLRQAILQISWAHVPCSDGCRDNEVGQQYVDLIQSLVSALKPVTEVLWLRSPN